MKKQTRFKRWPWILAGIGVFLIPLIYLAAAKTQFLPAFARIPAPHPRPAQTRDERWRQDVAYLAGELPRLHINAFHTTSREAFEQAATELDAAIPALNDYQIIFGISRLVAMLGEAHTRVIPPSSVEYHLYPLRFYWFDDGIYVIDAMPGYQDLIGHKVLQINGVAIEDAIAALTPMISRETEAGLKNRLPVFLLMLTPEMLANLGLEADGEAHQIKFEAVDCIPLDPVPAKEYNAYFTNFDNAWKPPHTPLYRRDRADFYWFEYLPDEGTIYVQFNRCAEKQDQSFEAFNRELFEFINTHPAQRLVLDMRFNGGGSSVILQPFIDQISRHPLNEPGKFFVIVGRETFSSAVLNALELQQKTNAIFVGEPTSGSANHYGEYKTLILPNSKIKVHYSTKYFSTGIFDLGPMNTGDKLGGFGYAIPRYPVSEPNATSFIPNVEIEQSGSAYAAGDDPALDYILNYSD